MRTDEAQLKCKLNTSRCATRHVKMSHSARRISTLISG